MTESVKNRSKAWFVYIVRCKDGSLYTGISNNLHARIKAHNHGHGAKYTQSRRPVELLFQEPHASRSAASRREYQIKTMTRRNKIKLIEQSIPD